MPDTASVQEQLSPGERSRTWRARFLARERVARSLILVPSLYIVGALALAEAVPLIEDERDLLRSSSTPSRPARCCRPWRPG